MSPGTRHVTEPRTSDGCRAVSEVLQRVGDKWSVLVVMTLRDGSMRFSELRRALEGISQRMLTLTVRGLERDGLVRRTVTATVIPPRVDYELTELGQSLAPPVLALAIWARENGAATRAARAAYDARASEAREHVDAASRQSLIAL